MHEVIGSIPIVSTKRKTDVADVRFSFGDDLFDRNNSRKARIWFAFPPKSASSSLVSGKAWNIAILCGTLRIANAGCLSNTRRQRRPFFVLNPLRRLRRQLSQRASLLIYSTFYTIISLISFSTCYPYITDVFCLSELKTISENCALHLKISVL